MVRAFGPWAVLPATRGHSKTLFQPKKDSLYGLEACRSEPSGHGWRTLPILEALDGLSGREGCCPCTPSHVKWRETRFERGCGDTGAPRVTIVDFWHKRIFCHSFRATGITEFLRNVGKLEVVQQLANHESARTTGLYDRRNDRGSLDKSNASCLKNKSC